MRSSGSASWTTTKTTAARRGCCSMGFGGSPDVDYPNVSAFWNGRGKTATIQRGGRMAKKAITVTVEANDAVATTIPQTTARHFSEAKANFDRLYQARETTPCIVPVNGKTRSSATIRDAQGKPNEEYYKWQFVHSLINSGLYARDYVGIEIQFPKGNNAVLRLDGAIFDSPDWLEHYNAYWESRHSSDLEWLNDHLLAVIEFKKNDKEIEKI